MLVESFQDPPRSRSATTYFGYDRVRLGASPPQTIAMTDTSSSQFSILTDAIAHRLLRYPDLGSSDEPGSALEEFASYLASEAWSTLPDSVRAATHETKESVPSESEVPLDTLSPAFVDTLVSYGIAGDEEDAAKFLYKVLAEYIEQATAPPPVWSSTRAEECEICERDVPLTYHHLIPKSVHAKVLKRRWHPESMLNSVAWLCRLVPSRLC